LLCMLSFLYALCVSIKYCELTRWQFGVAVVDLIAVIHLNSAFYYFFFKQKTAYDIGLGIPAEPLFRSMPTLNFLPVWFALSLLRFRLPSRLPMMFILWMVAMMVVIIPSRTV